MRKVLFIFAELTDEDVDWLVRIGKVEKLNAGVTIIERGKNVENIYLVLEGSFSVFFTADFSLPITTLHSGEMVGEMSFIDAREPSATVRSDGSALVLKISKPKLQSKLDTDKDFAVRFYRSTSMLLSDRLRSLSRRVLQTQGVSDAEFEDAHLEDELDPNVLEDVSFAGNRFDRMLKQLKKQA